MNEIIVGFSRPKGWFVPFSWLIRLVTWSPYSHAYIRYYDSYKERWIIFQASGLKVNFIGQAMFNQNETICKEFIVPISDENKKILLQKAVDECGSPYAVGQIVGFSWILLMRLFGKKVQNPFYSGSNYFCSELVGDDLQQLGYANLDPQVMDPKDLYNYMINNGFKTVE